jgi:hypothetical protein
VELIWSCRKWKWPPGCAASVVAGLAEELAEVLPDLATLGFAVAPVVGVDAEGGVGFAMPEAMLDVDEAVVERDQHAGVAVAEVVQGGIWRREVGSFECSIECGARGLSFEAGAVAAGEDKRVLVKAVAALGDECEQAAHELGWDVERAL